jgi:hypothetical protein
MRIARTAECPAFADAQCSNSPEQRIYEDAVQKSARLTLSQPGLEALSAVTLEGTRSGRKSGMLPPKR